MAALRNFAERRTETFDEDTLRMIPIDLTFEISNHFPASRFSDSKDSGVLYRPDIVIGVGIRNVLPIGRPIRLEVKRRILKCVGFFLLLISVDEVQN